MWSPSSIPVDSILSSLLGVIVGVFAIVNFLSLTNRMLAKTIFVASILLAILLGPVLKAAIPNLGNLSISFCLSYVITFLLLPIAFYIWHYKKLKSIIFLNKLRCEITFLDYCIYGIEAFKKKIQELDKKQRAVELKRTGHNHLNIRLALKKRNHDLDINQALRDQYGTSFNNHPLGGLILEIRDFVNSKLICGYTTYILKSCKENYFKGLTAHFTLYYYDGQKNCMETMHTTRRVRILPEESR